MDDIRTLRYLRNVLEQYKNATGAKNISLDCLFDNEIVSKIDDWAESRWKNRDVYLRALDNFGLSGLYKLRSTCEFGKGPYDSLVNKFNTTVISPVADKFDENYFRNRYIGRLAIIQGRPVLSKGGHCIILPNIETYMTQNPYSFDSLVNLEDIHNSGRARVLIGIYGGLNDKDRNFKLKQLKKIVERFTLSPKSKYYANFIQGTSQKDDTYFAFLISQNTNGMFKDSMEGRDERPSIYGSLEEKRLKKLR